MLSPYRVIDLTDESGILCAQILADLGADVIAVEPLGGSPARQQGPFAADTRNAEKSLFWWAYARNKRSIEIDLESESGCEELRRLIDGADFFVESMRPGWLEERGLDYEALAASNPGLVHVSMTPFGRTGPKAGWAATDLTVMAASGHAYLSGEADRPPVRIRVPQAHAHAGSDGAVGALIAHAERRVSGRGQHVDVSAQQSATLATMFRILDGPLEQPPARRVAGGIRVGRAFLPNRYPLRDGWVILGPGILPSTGHFMRRLSAWAAEEGALDPRYAEEDWGSWAIRLITDQLGPLDYEPVERALAAFFETKTKAELMKAAVERKLLLAPMLELDEIIESEQFAVRGFPVAVESEEAGRVRYPGPFARPSRTPIRYRLPPPRVNEHGAEIRAEAPRRPAPTGGGPPPAEPLEGVKILDLFWVLAGPGATRMLADYGATVVKVESIGHIDTLRVIPPYHYGNPHPECAGGFQCANANKLGVTVDMTGADGRDVILDLVRWADVVTESFAPGVIEGYGLGWDVVRETNPQAIMISSCLMGQTGPWRGFTGFGNLAATVTGFQQQASWPGRPPSGPFGAYTDFIAVRYNAAVILAALEHRARTGEGQYIDQSQAESALHFLAPAFLDYTVNGRVPAASGNHDDECFPHGVFPCRGKDRWVAIAVRDDVEWEALCEVVGAPGLCDRRDERAQVEETISEWTRGQDAETVTSLLQARGVPAHPVTDTPGLFEDAQLLHRGHFVEVPHEIFPSTTVESSRLVLSRSPERTPGSALSFGRDNRAVLEGILGYAPERIAALAARGVLS